MLKVACTIIAFISCAFCFGQNADTLNKESKNLLTIGDYKNAFPLLKQAAELGNAESQYNLGYSYQQGIQVIQNDSIANVWLLKSAIQGWRDAQFKIAYSYSKGRGINQDDAKAFYWALKCAEQNDPECMFNIITCYYEGVGTVKNTDSMLAWAIRLAILENPEDLNLSGHITSARLNLASMYKDGENVGIDLTKSYMWYLIYNENKRDFSVLVQWAQIDTIKELEKKLTPENKIKAKQDVEKLLNRKLVNFDNLYKNDY